jgi:uncharacterized protein with FMN-binding domain
MKRAILAIAGTVSGLVLLLSFKTHPAAGTGGGTVAPTSGTAPSPGGAATSGSTRTLTGDTVETRWGPVQVQVTLTGGRITRVQALRLPDGNPRDQEINDFAVPQLTQEALAAQSARIDAVSGATYTSDGYIRSLQSALDKT